MNYTAIILAGGKSSRFGKDKTLLKLNEELVIETIINKCRKLFSEIILVSNHQNKFGFDGVKEISDIYTEQGPLGGIHAGLMEAENSVCFVSACDMPFFNLPLVEHLLATAEGVDVVVPREQNGHLQPLFAVYNKNALHKVETLLSENKSSILNLYELTDVSYVDEPVWREITHGGGDVFCNINYVEDYERIIEGGLDTPIELEEAVRLLIKHTVPIKEVRAIPLIEASGQVSAENIFSPFDNPPFDRSPLDGYALCHKDSKGASKENPMRLKVIQEIFAGGNFKGEIMEGQAARIMTGAPIPKGCDCVIMQEDTDYGEDYVNIYKELKKHQNFCFKGEDVTKGHKLVSRGDTIGYTHLGVLSGMGISEVKIIRSARVGLMCTGDELVSIGNPLAHGKIYDSNLYMLAGRMTDFGIDTLTYPPVADNASEIADAIRAMAKETDVIITTGGVSVGKKDIMHEAFSLLEVNRLFWRVGFKPGTPALCGMLGEKPLICLSGNPFAAAATFELLARPVLSALTGREWLMYKRRSARLMNDFKKKSPERRFIRARLENNEVFLNDGNHSSGALFSMLGCNCLIDIPAGSPPLKSGTTAEVVIL